MECWLEEARFEAMARRRFSGGKRSRPTNWVSLADDPDNAFNVVSTAATVLVVRTIASSSIGPSTIIRVRGQLGLLGSEPVSALIGVGIGLVSDQAGALGVTAVPHRIPHAN